MSSAVISLSYEGLVAMNRATVLLLVIIVAGLPCLAWGWGCTGHEVVALIAQQNLRPEVAAQVESLLAAQTHQYSGRYCSDLSLDPIAYYATWADDYRTVHPETAPWHFWDIPLVDKSATATQLCDSGCVVQALNDQLAILRDSTQPTAQRTNALMFVIHFVGDLHQPLHAEDNNDRGGNCVPTGFLTEATKETDKTTGSFTPNLHGIWDTQLVETIGGVSPRSHAAVTAFAAKISKDDTTVIQHEVNAPVDFVAWGNESHTVARKDPYAKLPKKIGASSQVSPVSLCSDNNTSLKLAKKHESIQSSYINAVSDDVELQLARAGGRLAAVLNAALSSPSNPSH